MKLNNKQKAWLELNQLNQDVAQLVEVEPMTVELRLHSRYITKEKQCYSNVFKLVNTLDCLTDIEANKPKYCLVYAFRYGICFEHAILKLDGRYYDPTWERYIDLNAEYALVSEYSLDQVYDLQCEIWGCELPDLCNLKRLEAGKKLFNRSTPNFEKIQNILNLNG